MSVGQRAHFLPRAEAKDDVDDFEAESVLGFEVVVFLVTGFFSGDLVEAGTGVGVGLPRSLAARLLG